MRNARAAIAADPRHFGRAQVRLAESRGELRPAISSDLRLFASSFSAGFLFVSILLA